LCLADRCVDCIGMDNLKAETLELQIKDVVYRGKGLARVEGMVCFVPGVLPGETVTARVSKRHRRYLNADLVDVTTPSPARISPVCPLAFAPGIASPCPGCAYQHIDYTEEVRLKQAQLSGTLEHNAGVASECFANPVPSPIDTAYRNKIVLHEDNRAGQRVMGYFGEDNRTILDVPACPLAVPAINDAIEIARGDLSGKAVSRGGRVEHTFRYTTHDGALHYCDRPKRRAAWLTETTPVGDIMIPRGSFSQVNVFLAGKLVEGVVEHLESRPSGMVIDLYCGVGLFALGAARAGATEVLGIDSDRQAVQAAKHNARQLGMDRNVHFLASTAEAGLRRAMGEVSAEKVTLIADPPRSGLDKSVIRTIRDLPPEHLIYVSCAADTLARDLRALVDTGYRVERAQLFDMFPRTALFETVVSLHLETGNS